MPYNKIVNGNETQFQIQPEEAPSLLKALLLPAILPFIILWMISFKIGIITTIGLGIWIYSVQNSKKAKIYRYPTIFSASPEGVNFKGTIYNNENSQRIIIRNHMNTQYVFVSNYQGYHFPVSTAKGLQLRQKLIDVSYRIDIESGGRPITIAGGINEPTAYAILSDVCKITDLKA